MKTLIVDDERPARERLRTLLLRHDDVEILGECASGESAVEAIRATEPDIVFLDIRMPRMDGFAVLGPARGFDIVFLTAHDEHAVRAFETRAADFLLKPVGAKRLREALDRVREHMRGVRPRPTARRARRRRDHFRPRRRDRPRRVRRQLHRAPHPARHAHHP